jgi:single-stranded DNA-binding protein
MTAFALVAGKLWKEPEGRTSKTGKPFATAIVREGAGDAVTWWSVVAFADNAAELLRLKDGDVVSVSGPFTVESYIKDEQNRLRHKIVADRLAAPRLSGRKDAP